MTDSPKTFCPECNAEMDPLDVSCNECGYDFPQTEAEFEPIGIAYSKWADFALVIGAICAALGAVAGVFTAISGEVFTGVIGFFTMFALFVVFVRVQQLGK